MPYVESLYYLLLTGEIPTQKEVEELMVNFNNRRTLPQYVKDSIDVFPSESNPMAILSAVVMSLERESLFSIKKK